MCSSSIADKVRSVYCGIQNEQSPYTSPYSSPALQRLMIVADNMDNEPMDESDMPLNLTTSQRGSPSARLHTPATAGTSLCNGNKYQNRNARTINFSTEITTTSGV